MSDALTDVARDALAAAPCATLQVARLGVPDDTDVLLLEDRGRPVFFCPGDSALARAAAHREYATLTVPSGEGTVEFCGRLRAVTAERLGGSAVHTITLDVQAYSTR